uniref:exodeoxyribonuclease III n=1 Tax=Pundamilia nyererei TaxID=303518 RepID=A0A3B4GB71_9CICH
LTTFTMSNIKIITLNVKGINHFFKRHKIHSSLKKDRVQIALLQETHLTDSEHLKLNDWVGQIYYSSFNSKRSVYAPNTFDRLFYSNLLAKTSSVCPNHVIIGGDFNCGLSPETDYNPPKSQPPSKMAKAAMDFCSDLGLFDAWRVCNPHVKDFTFFSRPHFSFSRIDYMFVSRSVLDRTWGCLINTCALSDYSSVSMELLPPYYDPLSRHWRLNPALLSDPEFVKYLGDQWELCLSTNDLPGVSASTLLSLSPQRKRRARTLAKQLVLERNITNLEREFKKSSSVSVLKKLDAARSALYQLLTQKAETAIFYAKHKLFESGNKPGRLLARLAQGKKGSYAIPSLKDKKGVLQFEAKPISKIMKDPGIFSTNKISARIRRVRSVKASSSLESGYCHCLSSEITDTFFKVRPTKCLYLFMFCLPLP